MLNDVIKNNLIMLFTHYGVSIEQVNEFAGNYVARGLITQNDADEINLAIRPPEIEEEELEEPEK